MWIDMIVAIKGRIQFLFSIYVEREQLVSAREIVRDKEWDMSNRKVVKHWLATDSAIMWVEMH